MTHLPPDASDAEFRDAALASLGSHVQHSRQPIATANVGRVNRASCLQCGWSDDKDPLKNATLHVQSFRHAVMIASVTTCVLSLAPTEDVKL